MTLRRNSAPAAANDKGQVEGLGTTSDDSQSTKTSTVSPDHLEELRRSGITDKVITERGIYTARFPAQMPAGGEWVVSVSGAPVIVYPQRNVDGTHSWQAKTTLADMKYVGPKKDDPLFSPLKLGVLREVTSPDATLIVEGTKQGLAALSWAPESWAIYSIAGITGWMENGRPSPMLAALEGHDVCVVPDADAASSWPVWDGAHRLGEALLDFGASSTCFGTFPGAGHDGLDDYLTCWSKDRRRAVLERIVERAGKSPAGLTKRQAEHLHRQHLGKIAERNATESGRVYVSLPDTGDSLPLFRKLREILRERGSREGLYSSASRMVRSRRDPRTGRVSLEPVTQQAFEEIVARLAMFSKGTEYRRALPTALTFWDELRPVVGVVSSPIIHDDGSIVIENGYDEKTGLLLDLDPSLKGITVPDKPTAADVEYARAAILDVLTMDGEDGYDGFVFADEASRTNTVAMAVTMLMRPVTGIAPLFLFNGSQPGVGKGELEHLVHLIVTGQEASLQFLPSAERGDEEVDKRLYAAFAAGQTSIAFDEVTEVNSASLRLALTSPFYQGRRLGESVTSSFENLAVFSATGNHVSTPADTARRVVEISLRTDRPDVENRSNFKYPDIRAHVTKHRSDLLGALLTVIRAWYANGRPQAPQEALGGFGFATFSNWQKTVGSVLWHAGFTDFLGNVCERRRISDADAEQTGEFLAYLCDRLSTRFSSAEVRQLVAADADAPLPYGVERDSFKNDARKVGMTLGRLKKWYEFCGQRLRLVEAGRGHKSVRLWRVEALDNAPAPASGPTLAAATSPTQLAPEPPEQSPGPGREPAQPEPALTSGSLSVTRTFNTSKQGMGVSVALLNPEVFGPLARDYVPGVPIDNDPEFTPPNITDLPGTAGGSNANVGTEGAAR